MTKPPIATTVLLALAVAVALAGKTSPQGYRGAPLSEEIQAPA